MRDLIQVLSDEHGLLLTNYQINPEEFRAQEWIVNGISADHRTLVGTWGGSHPDRLPPPATRRAFAIFLDRPIDVSLRAGDADQDLDFDQLDLMQVQAAGKYLTSQPATWGEGDWNAASAIRGDGIFNQQAAVYLTGSYHGQGSGTRVGDAAAFAAMTAGGTPGDYDAGSGSLSIDAPPGVQLTSINIDSTAGIFTGSPAESLGGSFDNSTQNNIFKAAFGSSFGSLSFGNVAQSGLSEAFVLGDLSVVDPLAGGGDLGDVDLIYVPEPSTLVPAILSLVGISACRLKRRAFGRRAPATPQQSLAVNNDDYTGAFDGNPNTFVLNKV